LLSIAIQSAGSGAQTEVSFVSWNPKFQHILASTSYNGMTGKEMFLVLSIFLFTAMQMHISMGY